MVWGNHCRSRDLLLWIVIIISLLIYRLIFSQDISLIICVFFFLFSLLTTKVHKCHLFIYYLLGFDKYVRSKALRSGNNVTGQRL